MVRMLLALFALMLPLAALGVAITSFRNVFGRITRAGAVAIVAGVAAGLAATADQRFHPGLAGVAVAVAAFVLAVWLWPRASATRTVSVPRTGRQAAPGEEPAMTQAWTVIANEAPLAMRRRIAAAREANGRFLRLADAAPLDPEAIEWAVFVRRHVPELVARWQAEAAHMLPARRTQRAEQLVQSLEQIAGEAEVRSERLTAAATAAFDLSRRHVALRTGRQPLSD